MLRWAVPAKPLPSMARHYGQPLRAYREKPRVRCAYLGYTPPLVERSHAPLGIPGKAPAEHGSALRTGAEVSAPS